MGIAALALAAWLVGCQAPGVAPSDAPPSCERAWTAITASLQELHADAGKPAPSLPDRQGWISACNALDLSSEALRCLEPEEAARQPTLCADAMKAIDRTSLDQPFLDAMLPTPGAPRE